MLLLAEVVVWDPETSFMGMRLERGLKETMMYEMFLTESKQLVTSAEVILIQYTRGGKSHPSKITIDLFVALWKQLMRALGPRTENQYQTVVYSDIDYAVSLLQGLHQALTDIVFSR